MPYEIGQTVALIGRYYIAEAPLVSYQATIKNWFPHFGKRVYLLENLKGNVYGNRTAFDKFDVLIPENDLITAPPGFRLVQLGEVIPDTAVGWAGGSGPWKRFLNEIGREYCTNTWPMIVREE